jgi:hypothetical protein
MIDCHVCKITRRTGYAKESLPGKENAAASLPVTKRRPQSPLLATHPSGFFRLRSPTAALSSVALLLTRRIRVDALQVWDHSREFLLI